jgi:hypothetical protein
MDIVNNVKVITAWAGATAGSSADITSTVVVDTQGFAAVMFAVHAGAYTDGTHTLKIVECDNADGTTGATEVGSYQVQGAFGAASSNLVKKVGAALTKRYITLRITSAGVTTGCVFKSGIAILGHARNAPVA